MADFGTTGPLGGWSLTVHGPRICPLGPRCDLPVDVIFKSEKSWAPPGERDPQLIGAHKALLAEQSEGFPSPEDITNSLHEPVPLTEDATTLRLLFLFMHSKELGGPPVEILQKIGPADLIKLSKAAEKYMVHYIVGFCRLAILARVKFMPIEAFAYATTHGDSDLADLAAPLTFGEMGNQNFSMTRKAGAVFREVPDDSILRWFHFREGYIHLAETILTPPDAHINSRKRPHDCGVWTPYARVVLDGLPTKTMPLAAHLGKTGVKELVQGRWDSRQHQEMLGNCRLCRKRADEWEDSVRQAMGLMYTFSEKSITRRF
ncbi:hypothetical protein DFP72DRAFT_905579 [Ephemerocybe angulata]|uniref:BTB domain-containing protein n=1 Tax=Ephemerocybe angulata TaxID=980116 RepID=A0A8H6HSC4_9AGAR|nr:hypothetical protein DFP72DRAFT_905579 [Tulosesus angulatus]